MRADQVILGSILSEKANNLLASDVYSLKVALMASKNDIRLALKQVFGVDAVDVHTAITRGEMTRRARSKKAGAVVIKKPNVKKAYVRLKEGQKLPTALDVG